MAVSEKGNTSEVVKAIRQEVDKLKNSLRDYNKIVNDTRKVESEMDKAWKQRESQMTSQRKKTTELAYAQHKAMMEKKVSPSLFHSSREFVPEPPPVLTARISQEQVQRGRDLLREIRRINYEKGVGIMKKSLLSNPYLESGILALPPASQATRMAMRKAQDEEGIRIMHRSLFRSPHLESGILALPPGRRDEHDWNIELEQRSPDWDIPSGDRPVQKPKSRLAKIKGRMNALATVAGSALEGVPSAIGGFLGGAGKIGGGIVAGTYAMKKITDWALLGGLSMNMSRTVDPLRRMTGINVTGRGMNEPFGITTEKLVEVLGGQMAPWMARYSPSQRSALPGMAKNIFGYGRTMGLNSLGQIQDLAGILSQTSYLTGIDTTSNKFLNQFNNTALRLGQATPGPGGAFGKINFPSMMMAAQSNLSLSGYLERELPSSYNRDATMANFWTMPFFEPGSTRSLISQESLQSRTLVRESLIGGQNPFAEAITLSALFKPGMGYADYIREKNKVGLEPGATGAVMNSILTRAGGSENALAFLIERIFPGVERGGRLELLNQLQGSGFSFANLTPGTRTAMNLDFGGEGKGAVPLGDTIETMMQAAEIYKSSAIAIQNAAAEWAAFNMEVAMEWNLIMNGSGTPTFAPDTTNRNTANAAGTRMRKKAAMQARNEEGKSVIDDVLDYFKTPW